MGVVYEAFDGKRGQVVALKTLMDMEPAGIFRLKREFRALADVVHPNLVSLHELVAEGDQIFFTMELIEGTDFVSHVCSTAGGEGRDTVQQLPGDQQTEVLVGWEETVTSPAVGHSPDHATGPAPGAAKAASTSDDSGNVAPDLGRLFGAFSQLIDGVAALHAAGKLHRDLKPSNVLVTHSGRVVLLDFGLARNQRPQDVERSLDDGLVGTPAYMSPEQAAEAPVTPASDWYSVGVMLYQVLTGKVPFAENMRRIMRRKQHDDPPPPSKLARGVPERWDRLCMQLLQRDPEMRPDIDQLRQWLHPDDEGQVRRSRRATSVRAAMRSVPLVGRERHLRELCAAFEEATGKHQEPSSESSGEPERPVLCWVHGHSGMGKSALLQQFKNEIRSVPDTLILSGRCYERESVPYQALDSLIDALCAHLCRLSDEQLADLLPDDIVALARLFPVLRRVDAIAEMPPEAVEILEPQEFRQRAASSLKELLARLAARHRLVLVIDDLQWGDADGAALLVEILRSPGAPRGLLLGSFRSDEAEASALLSLLLEHPQLSPPQLSVHRLQVDRLSDEEAESLVRFLLLSDERTSAAEISARRCRSIARESHGSPFLVRELVHHSQLMDPSDADAGERVPVTLGELLQARLGTLSQSLRRLVEVVATAGQPVDQEIAIRAISFPAEELPALALLQTENLLRLRTGVAGDLLEVYHDRIRETVVASLSADALAGYHLGLARALEARGRGDAEALARHFEGAGKRQKAASYARTAALAAEEALAFDHAARLFRLAARLQEPDAPRGDLLTGLGRALANAGRGGEAAQAYLDAARCPETDAVQLRRLAATHYLSSGHRDQGMAVLRTVLGQSGLRLAKTPRRALASLVWRRAHLRLRGLGFKERPEADIPRSKIDHIDMHWSLSRPLGMIDTIRAQDLQTRHVILALQAGEPYRVSRALAMEAAFSASSGGAGLRRTERLVVSSLEMAEASGRPQAIAHAQLCAAIAHFCLGRWQQSLEHIGEAHPILRDQCTGVAWELATASSFHICCLFYLGRLDQLRAFALRRLDIALERGDLYQATALRTTFGELAWLVADDIEEARRQVELAAQTWSQSSFQLQHYWALRANGYIDLYTGEGALAWERLSENWPALRRSLLLRVQVIRVQMVQLRANAAIAAALDSGERERLLRSARRDARAIARERMPWSRPLAMLLRASLAVADDDPAAAVDELAAAEPLLEAQDMQMYAAAARVCRGHLLGGTDGASVRQRGRQAMERAGVQSVERMTRMLIAGILDAGSPSAAALEA